MKKIFLAAAMALGVFCATAQNKIGYISPDDLIGIMPEAEKADAELKDYQEALGQQGQELMQQLSMKDSVFSKDSSKLTPSMRDIRRRELIELYSRVQNFQNEAQQLYQQKAQEKIAPIRDKAVEAIRAVAKENGYNYVLDVSSIIVAPPGDDLLPLVKKKLGIKDPAPAATTPKK